MTRYCAIIFTAALLLLAVPSRADGLAALRAKAQHNDTAAQFTLGWQYYEGVGTPVNYDEAAKWLKKAAARGNADAQYYLACLYEYGKGVKQDFTAARKWLLKSAAQNDAQAQSALSMLYQNGWGVKRDTQEACVWMMLSSMTLRLPDAPSCTDLAYLLSATDIANAREKAQNWALEHKQKPAPKTSAKNAGDG